jgi:hypothetical protein
MNPEQSKALPELELCPFCGFFCGQENCMGPSAGENQASPTAQNQNISPSSGAGKALAQIYREARIKFLYERIPDEKQWATEQDLIAADEHAAQAVRAHVLANDPEVVRLRGALEKALESMRSQSDQRGLYQCQVANQSVRISSLSCLLARSRDLIADYCPLPLTRNHPPTKGVLLCQEIDAALQNKSEESTTKERV